MGDSNTTHETSTTVGETFARFYVSSYPTVERALALTLRDRELGREAAQEAMARALARWSVVSGYANPRGWVFRVGLNYARSRLRRVAREVLGLLRDRPATPVEAADPAVGEMLDRLPVEHRAVLVLRFYLEFTIADTAAALGIPEGTVRSRQRRGLEQARELLEEDDRDG